jgi:DNA (cytosine-5)-methyltransferase 1
MASRAKRYVEPPEATHAKHPAMSLFGETLPWVSMMDALGWGSNKDRVGFPRRDDGLGTSADGYRDRDWRDADEPSFVVTEKARSWTVHTRRDWVGERRQTRTTDQPAPTFTFKSGGQWQLEERQSHGAKRGPDEPAMTITASSDNGNFAFHDEEAGTRRPITIPEALVLQGFAVDRPITGTRTSKFRQIGNAIPPPLAHAIVKELLW